MRLDGQPDWYEQHRRTRLARLPPSARRRYVDLQRRRGPGVEAELRRLAARADFADPVAAQTALKGQEAELTAVNDGVNRELGADFERFFAARAIGSNSGRSTFRRCSYTAREQEEAVSTLADERFEARLPARPRIGRFVSLERGGHLHDHASPDMQR